MNVLGIVAEYNPFHNGHLYHLNASIKKSKASHVVCIMSGNFLQRGEPALLDKWIRTEMAIASGIDLVIELPFAYACNSAEFFAHGGISILDQLNCVNFLSFGSESNNIEDLKTIADFLSCESLDYQNTLKSYLNQGLSFPKARELATSDFLKPINCSEALRNPNNILGIEYLKQLNQLNSKITPLAISRKDAGYNDPSIFKHQKICSATAIRNALYTGTDSFLENVLTLNAVVPDETFSILKNAAKNNFSPVFLSDFESLLLYTLRKATPSELGNLFAFSEGIENRFKKSANLCKDLDSLLDAIKTKRYTLTHLKRLLIYALMGFKKEDFSTFSRDQDPHYARILGFSKNGLDLLNKIKKTASIELITNINKFHSNDPAISKMLEYDLLAGSLYSLGYADPVHRLGIKDYMHPPVMGFKPPARNR